MAELFVTSVEVEADSTVLKVWGQTDEDNALRVEYAIFAAHELFEDGKFEVFPSDVEIGEMYCAKFRDGKYYRATVETIDKLNEGLVGVRFIDYGNSGKVAVSDLRSLRVFKDSFEDIPPQAAMFILSGVVFYGDEWDDLAFSKVQNELLYQHVNFEKVCVFRDHQFINIVVEDQDFAEGVVKAKNMKKVPLRVQEKILFKDIEKKRSSSKVAYKQYVLNPYKKYEVYVSNAEFGAGKFFVRLWRDELELRDLMYDINSEGAQQLRGIPAAGTICLARCLQDDHLYRAEIKAEKDGHYEVFYVDFGYTEMVPRRNLYCIPNKFLELEAGAICLSSNTDAIILDRLVKSQETTFVEFQNYAIPEDMNTTDDLEKVKVSYVSKNGVFYVQRERHSNTLNEMMNDMQLYCSPYHSKPLENPKVGEFCAAKFEDGLWYRAHITALKEDVAEVEYFDFGNRQDIPKEELKELHKDLAGLDPLCVKCSAVDNCNSDLIKPDNEFLIGVVDLIGETHIVEIERLLSVKFQS